MSSSGPSISLLHFLLWNFLYLGRIPTMVAFGTSGEVGGAGRGESIPTSGVDEALKNAWTTYGPVFLQNASKPRVMRSAYEGPIPTLISPFFQPMTSEWDSLISDSSKPPDVLVPNFLNNLLSASIVFQVNNDEEVVVLEKIGLGFLMGTLVSTWVLLGIGISAIPIKWILSKKDIHELIVLEELGLVTETKGPHLTEIERRVKAALGEGWLRDLK